jgi:hypothetical protein
MDIKMVQGDDLRVMVTVKDQDNQLVSITGAPDITWAVATLFGGVPIITKNLSSGVTIGNDSMFYFDITAANSGALQPGVYRHEAQITTTGGLKYTTMRGTLRIDAQIIV